jgi:hypothetical protein
MTSALTSDSDEYGGRVAAESGDRSDAAQRQAVVIGTDGQTIGGSFGLVHHQPETAGTVQTGRRPRRRELIGDVAIAEKDGQFRRGGIHPCSRIVCDLERLRRMSPVSVVDEKQV